MSEPVQPTQPDQAAQSGRSVPPPTGARPPVRPDDSGGSEEAVRRKLLMGAALLLALASIYAGVFNVGRLAQIVLAAGATMAVVMALTSGSRRRNS
jgi:hypothetical protein